MINNMNLAQLQNEICARLEEYGYPTPTLNDFPARLHLDVSRVYMKVLEHGGISKTIDFVDGPAGMAPDGCGIRLAQLLVTVLWTAHSFGLDLQSSLEVLLNFKKSLHARRERLAQAELKVIPEETSAETESEPTRPE